MMFHLKKRKRLETTTEARKLITLIDTKSIVSEQFRTIRTNISFSLPDKPLKVILVTSSVPGEGKSTNAANIGVVFAQEGKKVLLIDADMRKPTIHYTFEMFNTIGLSSLLTKDISFQNVIHETFIVGLDVITSGPVPPNPSELLSSKKMDTFMEDIINLYDIIIFDAPPILSVTDAQILSNKCDGTLLIVNTGQVEKKDVIKAKSILDSSKGKILGVILNNFPLPKSKHYYQYYTK